MIKLLGQSEQTIIGDLSNYTYVSIMVVITAGTSVNIAGSTNVIKVDIA